MAKQRLDVTVFERGLAPSREKAQALIMAGQIYLNGQKVSKAGASVKPEDQIELHGTQLPFVSRGGLKLNKAMQCFPITLEQKICMDVGASTGGFTDCMLQMEPARFMRSMLATASLPGSYAQMSAL